MKKLGQAVLACLVSVGVSFVGLLFRFSARRYQRLHTLCEVACFIEAWIKITDGKPVDLDSQLSQQINAAIRHYFAQDTRSRTEVAALERAILPLNYYRWVLRHQHDGEVGIHFRFARDRDIAAIINHYLNIDRYINYCATEEVRSFEEAQKLKPSAAYWKRLVEIDELPTPLKNGAKTRAVRAYLKKKVYELKSDLARRNYTRVDIAPSDLTAFITLSGTLLLLLGYLRISAISVYFGIPYHRYFSSSDYIANSVAAIDSVFLAAIAATIFASLNIATMNAYSLPSEAVRKPLHERAATWMFHFIGLSSLAALLVGYFTQSFESGVLFIAVIYIGVLAIANVSKKFFLNPSKAYLFIMFFFLSIAGSVDSVIREIQALSKPAAGPRRIIEFSNATYLEPEWRVLAITNSFVILRRQSDGLVQVHAKSDLKRINDVPSSLKRSGEDGKKVAKS